MEVIVVMSLSHRRRRNVSLHRQNTTTEYSAQDTHRENTVTENTVYNSSATMLRAALMTGYLSGTFSKLPQIVLLSSSSFLVLAICIL